MKRPVAFAIEVAAAMLIAVVGAYLAARFNGKFNRSNQAAERIAGSLETIAAAAVRNRLPRPSLLYPAAEIRVIERPAPDPDPCQTASVGHPL